MAGLTPKLLYIGNATGSNVYTSNTNANSYTIIKNINICNTSNSNVTCSFHIVESSQSATNNNKIISNVQVLANDVVFYNTSIVLPSNASIYASQGVGAELTFTISGVEYIG